MLKNYKISLFNTTLFFLSLVYWVPSIYVFSKMKGMANLLEGIEIILYAMLIVCILKKGYTPHKLMMIFIVLGILLFCYMKSGLAAFFRAALVIVAADGIKIEKIFRTLRYAITFIMVMSIGLFVLGISDPGLGRRGALTLGFAQANYCGIIVLSIFLLFFMEKKQNYNLRNYLTMLGLLLLSWFFTNNRSAIVLGIIFPIVVWIVDFFLKSKIKSSKRILMMLPVFLILITLLLVKLYETSSLVRDMDIIFSHRLWLNYYNYTKYGTTLWGQNIDINTYGQAIYMQFANKYTTYNTIDSTYMCLLVFHGMIPTLIYCYAFSKVIKKAWNNKWNIVLAVAILLSAYGFVESSMIEICKNFVFLILTANIADVTSAHDKSIFKFRYEALPNVS